MVLARSWTSPIAVTLLSILGTDFSMFNALRACGSGLGGSPILPWVSSARISKIGRNLNLALMLPGASLCRTLMSA